MHPGDYPGEYPGAETVAPVFSSVTGDEVLWPAGRLPVVVETLIDGQWRVLSDASTTTDGRSRVKLSEGVEITRGQGAELSGQSIPTRAAVSLRNHDGLLSPRNPVGAWYGLLGRNTPLRVSIGQAERHLWIPGAGTYLSTPDTAALSITGDIDVRVDFWAQDWTNAGDLAGKYGAAGARSWALYRTTDRRLAFRWSVDGTAILERFSTARLQVPGGRWRVAVRATLDVNNGAGGHTVTFYTAPSLDGPWTQLGDPVVTAGTTSIADTTSPVLVGAVQTTSTAVLRSRLYGAEIRSGIGGTVVARPRPDAHGAAGAPAITDDVAAVWGQVSTVQGTSLTSDYAILLATDAASIAVGDRVQLGNSSNVLKEATIFTVARKSTAFGYTNLYVTPPAATEPVAGDKVLLLGNLWTVKSSSSAGVITDREVVAYGAVPEWPSTGGRARGGTADVVVRVEASGLLRQLGQGRPPLASVMRRTMTDVDLAPNVVGYWSCEESSGADSIGSGLDEGADLVLVDGDDTDFGSDDGFACSGPLPVLGDLSQWSGSVEPHTGGGVAQLRWLMRLPPGATAPPDNQTIIQLNTWGTVGRWQVTYNTGGALSLRCYDRDGGSLATFGPYAFDLNNRRVRVSLELTVSGSDTTWKLVALRPGFTSGPLATGTLTGATFTRSTGLVVSPGGTLPGVVIGHISVENAITDLFALADQVNAYRGESAGRRAYRLCTEEGLPYRLYGDIDDTAEMGYQLPKTLLELLTECAEADGGQLVEARDNLSIGLMPLSAIASQEATLTLPYSLVGEVEPSEDDQFTRNDITRRRTGGSSRRVLKTTGSLSTQAPPAGVGVYADDAEVNVSYDRRLKHVAGWARNLGTVDEPRFPAISIKGEHPGMSAAQRAGIRALDVAGRLVVTGLPSWLSYDDITQLAAGTTLRLTHRGLHLDITATPETPYQVGRWSDGITRWGKSNSTLGVEASPTAATLQIVTASGRLWTNNPASFPLDILVAGERIRVTSITGTTSPQSANVVRSINGVVKTLPAGSSVQLWQPRRWKP